MIVLEVAVFALVAAAGTAVVLTRNPVNQAIVASFYGLVLGIMFLVYQAPTSPSPRSRSGPSPCP